MTEAPRPLISENLYQVFIWVHHNHRRQLHNLSRFPTFIPEAVNPMAWKAALGPDVNGRSHPGVIFNITRDFIATQNYNRASSDPLYLNHLQQKQLQATPLFHDFGEIKIQGIGPGDIADPEKNLSSTKEETLLFQITTLKAITRLANLNPHSIITNTLKYLKPASSQERAQVLQQTINNLIDHLNQKAPPETLRLYSFINTIYHDIAQNSDSLLGQMFKAIEKVGYLNTGIRAYKSPAQRTKKITNRDPMVAEIIQFHMPYLLTKAPEYPYVDQYLTNHQVIIDQMFQHIQTLATLQMPLPIYKNSQTSASFFSPKEFFQTLKLWQERKALTGASAVSL